ncbi:hypothetical protein BKA58DRAFT_459617 [Alternaria rosae]|uniref:uncharacterized protein n=1 Tax=Alternaria rosae TaxID=1187941 RepID=UPI001E8E52D9|nr:uncharacterized protein BKA58DRAFT_459617 [Alternaria rosae]KAH6868684.1 hypothetical protein BKA58DRAFT_459617 [Alternaria rosae]
MSSNPKTSSTSSSPTKGARVEKPAAMTKARSKNKDGSIHASPTDIFGPNAVTRYLSIPQTGNITGVELMTFLPELIRSPGILVRFFQNGGDAGPLTRIYKWFRVVVKNNSRQDATNAMIHLAQGTMRNYLQDDQWTMTRYRAGLYSKVGQAWDHDNLTFTGVKNHCEIQPLGSRHNKPVVANVHFASLAADVLVYPSDYDELDLTRCVKAAVANIDLPLMFPRDFNFLTRLLGGPQTVLPAHQDGPLFERWRLVPWNETPKPHAIQAATNLGHHTFTAAQRAVTERHLHQLPHVHPSASASARPSAYVQLPISAPRGLVRMINRAGIPRAQVPVAASGPQSDHSLILSRILGNTAADLAHVLVTIQEDQLRALYVSVLAANGIVPSRRRVEHTPVPDVLYNTLGGDGSLAGPIVPAAHDAMVLSSYGPWDNDIIANDNESPLPNSFDEQLDDDSGSFASLDLSMTDPEILDSINRELGTSIDLEPGTEPPKVDPEDHDLGLQDDGVNDGLVQGTSSPSIVVRNVDGSIVEHPDDDHSTREA